MLGDHIDLGWVISPPGGEFHKVLLVLVAATAVAQEIHVRVDVFGGELHSGLLFELFQIGVDLGRRIPAGQLDDLGLEVVPAQIAQQHAPG